MNHGGIICDFHQQTTSWKRNSDTQQDRLRHKRPPNKTWCVLKKFAQAWERKEKRVDVPTTEMLQSIYYSHRSKSNTGNKNSVSN